MRQPIRLPSRFTRSLAGIARRMVPRRVRVRLTLLYGVLFVALGVVLLAITYLLVAHRTAGLVLGTNQEIGSIMIRDGSSDLGSTDPATASRLDLLAQQMHERAIRQHEAELHHLLVQSGIALAIMAVIAIVLAWMVAGRVLRPLRTMTETIRRISARNLHERLAVDSPADELKDLADTVDGLLGRLETALDSHKRFVANAAHELRTPLTVEHALLEEALIDRDATVESFRSNFERLLAISKQQERLLESLLTLASSERGLENPEPLDLSILAEQVVHTSLPEMERRGLRVEAAIEPASTSGDLALVQRLVANLVDNAVGYNVPGGQVEIKTGTRGGRSVVSVANTGPEVPAEQVARLFEPFQRLHRTAGDGHRGLGLSIVKAIATAHHALITAHARQGGGLVVEVAFPLGAERPGKLGSGRPSLAAAAHDRDLPVG